MADVDAIRKRWRYVDEAPGGTIAFDDVNALLEELDRLTERAMSLFDRSVALQKKANAEARLRDEYRDQVTLRDAVLEALWTAAVDDGVTDMDFNRAAGEVLAAWFDRAGEGGA